MHASVSPSRASGSLLRFLVSADLSFPQSPSAQSAHHLSEHSPLMYLVYPTAKNSPLPHFVFKDRIFGSSKMADEQPIRGSILLPSARSFAGTNKSRQRYRRDTQKEYGQALVRIKNHRRAPYLETFSHSQIGKTQSGCGTTRCTQALCHRSLCENRHQYFDLSCY